MMKALAVLVAAMIAVGVSQTPSKDADWMLMSVRHRDRLCLEPFFVFYIRMRVTAFFYLTLLLACSGLGPSPKCGFACYNFKDLGLTTISCSGFPAVTQQLWVVFAC